MGETISLTQPMGWNSWYIHSECVSEKAVREIAAAMEEKGLTDHGDERAGHRVRHHPIALFGEGLLLPLVDHNRSLCLAGALPVSDCASGS